MAIYLQENAVSVTQIPFPAVTICPGLNLDVKGFNYEQTAEAIINGELLIEDLPIET